MDKAKSTLSAGYEKFKQAGNMATQNLVRAGHTLDNVVHSAHNQAAKHTHEQASKLAQRTEQRAHQAEEDQRNAPYNPMNTAGEQGSVAQDRELEQNRGMGIEQQTQYNTQLNAGETVVAAPPQPTANEHNTPVYTTGPHYTTAAGPGGYQHDTNNKPFEPSHIGGVQQEYEQRDIAVQQLATPTTTTTETTHLAPTTFNTNNPFNSVNPDQSTAHTLTNTYQTGGAVQQPHQEGHVYKSNVDARTGTGYSGPY